MSIDLKGNTNYVALKNLQEQYIVPRTNLAAIDMTVSNGLEVNGNNIGTKSATAAELMNGVTNGSVLTPKTVANALSMGQASILDMHTHTILPVNGAIEWSFNGNQIDITGTASSTTSGIAFLGPVSGPATKTGKFLMTFDVFVPSTAVSTNFSLTGPTTMTAVSTYPVSTTTKGSWVRIAILINTTSAVYTGNINFLVTVANGGAVAFSLANGRLIDVSDMGDSDIVYMVTAGQYNETVAGETVIKEGNPTQLYKPGYGIKIKGDTIEIDTSVLATAKDEYIYGIDWNLGATSNTALVGGAIQRVVMDRSNGIISEVKDFDHLPAHEGWRRCVMDDLTTKHVNYYLDANDSNLKEDHSPAVLTGEDGNVMVEWPITYVRVDTYKDSDNKDHQRWLISLTEFEGSKPHDAFYSSGDGKTASIQYVGAFRMGGFNYAGEAKNTDENSWSCVYAYGSSATQIYYGKSVAGVKPLGGPQLANFRDMAENSGGHVIGTAHAQFLALMMLIEYGSDIQRAFGEGYVRTAYIGYGQIRMCGRTAVFGNNSTPATAIHANDLYEAGSDDECAFFRPTFAVTDTDTYVIRMSAADVNVGKLTYNSNVYTRDNTKDVGYQIIVGGSTFNRTSPFEHVSEGETYYGWTNGTLTYYTLDHSPTTSSILYSDVFGDVSTAVIEGDTDLYAWYNSAVTPTTIYTTVEKPAVGNVTAVDYDDVTLGTATKGLDAYAWRTDKKAYTKYTATARPAVGDKLYSDTALTTAYVTITSLTWAQNAPAKTIVQCSYRGIEDPFGSQWCFEDGAWGTATIQVQNKTYYATVNNVGSVQIGSNYYAKWVTDDTGSDAVWTVGTTNYGTAQSTGSTVGSQVYNVSGSSATAITGATVQATSGGRVGAVWMTNSRDAYARISAVKIGDVMYYRNSIADKTVNNTDYYGWKSDADAIIYSTTKAIAASGTVYTISGTTVTSAGTVTTAYKPHETFMHTYNLAVTNPALGEGYAKYLDPHTMWPTTIGSGAGENAWVCDYYYNSNATNAHPRVVTRGGYLNNGGAAGPFYVNVNNAFSHANWSYGSRLVA